VFEVNQAFRLVLPQLKYFYLSSLMEATIKTEVAIIGAGPTGLSLAAQFVRHRIDFVIIDKNEGITPYSKAIGVQARTLEIYDQIRLAQAAVEQGTIAERGRLLIGGEVRGELDFSNIGEGLSPFPFVLMLEQSKNEQLLYEYLLNHRKQVLWKTELESFSQDTAAVRAQVRDVNGTIQSIEAKYLVGCDGPKSLVRHALGLSLEGSTFERTFYVADAQIDGSLSHEALNICFAENSFVVFFPLKGEKRYRIVGVFPEEFNKDEGEVLYEEIEARIKDEAKLDLDIHDVEWFSTYKVHTRHVSKFSQGRCFLSGDAAHIHSPAGAQGMNTGIQDAYNLAWKLALVIQDRADERLLETYNEERLENAKHLLKTTDRIFEFAAGTDSVLNFLRMNIFPPVAKYIFSFEPIRKLLFPLLSQTGIDYRHSSLSEHAGDEDFEVKAGDRMPYFLVDRKGVYEKLQQPKFHWLVFSNTPSGGRTLKMEFERQYADLIDVSELSLSSQVADIFGTNELFNLLLRPDNHVGFIAAGASSDRIAGYLKNFLGLS
jgi:2-polyprenyl-6-methoxyphenol hydroxylase-like FAD-dependent oxidoreductase